MSTILLLHKDSSKFVQVPQVPIGQELSAANDAFETIKKTMGEPEMHASRCAVFEIEGDFRVVKSRDLHHYQNPPENIPPSITTYGAENR